MTTPAFYKYQFLCGTRGEPDRDLGEEVFVYLSPDHDDLLEEIERLVMEHCPAARWHIDSSVGNSDAESAILEIWDADDGEYVDERSLCGDLVATLTLADPNPVVDADPRQFALEV